jgi:hypothetical protein
MTKAEFTRILKEYDYPDEDIDSLWAGFEKEGGTHHIPEPVLREVAEMFQTLMKLINRI